MENYAALEERVTKLEYFWFEQFPPKMAAMDFAASQIYAHTQHNGEAIAGLRVDMAAMETRMHADTVRLKAVIDLQADELRKQIGSTRAEVLTSVTALRGRVDQRFERLEGQIGAVKQDVTSLKQGVTVLKDDVTSLKDDVTVLKQDVTVLKQDVAIIKEHVDQRLGTLDGKLDTLITEIRSGRN